MGYKAALHLLDLSRQAGLLRDGLVRNMILAVAVDDDPDLLRDAEDYIGFRAVDALLDGGRTGRRYRE